MSVKVVVSTPLRWIIVKYRLLELTHPWFVAREAKSLPNRGFVGIEHRIIVDTIMITKPDWFIVRFVWTMEDVDWFCKVHENDAISVQVF